MATNQNQTGLRSEETSASEAEPRTFQEMFDAAVSQRRALIDEGKDPFSSEFKVTPHEMATIQLYPRICGGMDIEKKTLCGLKIVVATKPEQPR